MDGSHVLQSESDFTDAPIDTAPRLYRADTKPPRELVAEPAVAEPAAVECPTRSAWERVELARHKDRPRALDYVSRIFDDFVELHGDRLAGDDPAMIGGIARFRDRTIMVVGQQKGMSFEDKIRRNFGMARPQGYRKALRIFDMAERLQLPLITLVDTPAADPHPDSERAGQGPAIAQNIRRMLGIRVPVFSVVLGEGGSGGALGIAVADHTAMMENAIYVVCPPERCAEILWKDQQRKELAATAMKVTADDLLQLGVVDSVITEPGGGAHLDPSSSACNLATELAGFLDSFDKGEWSPARRQARFRKIGAWTVAG